MKIRNALYMCGINHGYNKSRSQDSRTLYVLVTFVSKKDSKYICIFAYSLYTPLIKYGVRYSSRVTTNTVSVYMYGL